MKRKKITRIALIAPIFGEEYVMDLVRGAYEGMARESKEYQRDYQLCLFDGNQLESDNSPEDLANRIYLKVNPEDFSGVLISGGLLGHWVTKEVLHQFYRSFHPLPVVLIGAGAPGFIQVTLDNYNGLYQITKHMIQTHGAEKIIYLGGPKDHPESVIREKAFKQALADHGLECSDENIIRGDLSVKAGYEAAQEMMKRDSTLNSWDCLIAADDDMAYGAMTELQAQDYSIPKDLAITGFDNSDLSISTQPPLTTAENSVYHLAQRAFHLLIQSINGQQAESMELPSPMVVRSSCGCNTERPITHPLDDFGRDPQDGLKTLYPYLSTEEQQILDSLNQSMLKALHEGEYESFQKEIIEFVSSKDQDSYQLLYQTLMLYLSNRGKKEVEEALWPKLESLIFHVEMSLLEKRILKDRASYVRSRSTRYHLLLAHEAIRNAGNLKSLKNLLAENLEILQISDLFLCLYEESRNIQRQAKLFFAYRDKIELDVSQWPPFPYEVLLPRTLWSQSKKDIHIISPLFYSDKELGYAIFRIHPENFYVARGISRQLSNILTHIFRSSELNEKNLKLESSIRELRITQERLMESERLAALGEMVAGIAHEINTPLGVGITLSSHMKDILKEADDYLGKNDESKEFWNSYLERNRQALDLLCNNLEKAAHMVRSYKMIAVDQTSEQQRIFQVHSYIQSIVYGLRSEYKHRKVQIQIKGCEDININSYPGFISQIISNLLMNSLQHGFPNKGGGNIEINIEKDQSNLLLFYKDDGIGIPQENKSRIFDPFFTTGRISGRSGLGMHIVYNIITAQLGGEIQLLPVPKGTAFRILFPVEMIKE